MKRCSECGLFAPTDAAACARCEGTSFAAEGAPLLVDGRYSLEDQLGAGGMGVVYRARDVWLDRPVAIKLISPKLLQQAGDLTAQFRREAATLASVRSEHVVQVYAFGPHEGSFFFAMEYVRGKDLEEIMVEHANHGEAAPLARMLTIMQQAALGLGAVHRAGLVHLDVKPSNIVIEEDTGRPVLVDFGLARWRGQGAQTVKVSGTPYYMAPERCGLQVETSALTPQTDVYSLGCMLFEVLTGEAPFDGASPYAVLAQHIDAPVPKVSDRKPELAEFDAIVDRAMAKSPGDRYATCEAFAEAIANVSPKSRAAAAVVVAPPPPAEVALSERVFRVLVVDDDPDFRKLASRAAEIALRGLTISIVAVGSGEEAVRAARQAPPDLMTLDFDMPGLDGTETLSELRAIPQGTQTRVAVVSGSAGPAERWRFAVLGVNEFIRKPIDFRDLTDSLRRIARRSGWIDVKPKSAATAENSATEPSASPVSPISPNARPPVTVTVKTAHTSDPVGISPAAESPRVVRTGSSPDRAKRATLLQGTDLPVPRAQEEPAPTKDSIPVTPSTGPWILGAVALVVALVAGYVALGSSPAKDQPDKSTTSQPRSTP